jgi:hypothetical protein
MVDEDPPQEPTYLVQDLGNEWVIATLVIATPPTNIGIGQILHQKNS